MIVLRKVKGVLVYFDGDRRVDGRKLTPKQRRAAWARWWRKR